MRFGWAPLAALLALLPVQGRAADPGPPDEAGQALTVDSQIPVIPWTLAHEILPWLRIRVTRFEAWLPDGAGMLVSTRLANTTQIYRLASAGAGLKAVTQGSEPSADARVRPDGTGFIYRRDTGGDEVYQLSWVDLQDDRSMPLAADGRRHGAVHWSHNGQHYAYARSEPGAADTGIVLVDADSGATRLLLAEPGSWTPLAFSPDDRTLLGLRYRSTLDSELWLIDLETGKRRQFDAGPGPVAYGDAAFSPDGRGLWYVSDRGSEMKRLHYADLDGGNARCLSDGIDWDVEALAVSDDGSQLAYSLNVDGVSVLQVVDTASGATLRFPRLPPGVISSLAYEPETHRLALTVEGPRTPVDVVAITPGSGQPIEHWSWTGVEPLSLSDFGRPETIRYASFDGRQIPALVYRPEGPGPHPVLIDLHGGPAAQSRPGFDPLREYYRQKLGIAVIEPNVRGSSGYGKTWLALDDGRRREDAVRDVGALLDWVSTQPDLDSDRIAVLGGSYGGYLALASLVHYGDRLRGGVDIVGISRFASFLAGTSPWRADQRRAEYGDERDPDMRAFLESISPANHASRINRPVFVAQGLNDPRVPKSESLHLLTSIRAEGGEVWAVLAEDEGHSFRKQRTADDLQQALALWLDRFLVGDSTEAK